jgi:hypothetical protein
VTRASEAAEAAEAAGAAEAAELGSISGDLERDLDARDHDSRAAAARVHDGAQPRALPPPGQPRAPSPLGTPEQREQREPDAGRHVHAAGLGARGAPGS